MAVLVRLCSMSILLSYACAQVFLLTNTIMPKLENLSNSLLLWVLISVVLLGVYFSTQQEISVEKDKDDKRRRMLLRMKCLYAMAGTSLVSLLVMVWVVRYDDWDAGGLIERVRSGDLTRRFVGRILDDTRKEL
jgi:cell division protein FtsW (lipid II flippase)